MHGCLTVSTSSVLSFHVFRNQNIIYYMNYNTMSGELFYKQVSALTTHMEMKVSSFLLEKGFVVLNGYGTWKAHFVSIYITFALHTELRFTSVLFAFSLLQSDEAQSAKEYVFSLRLLSVFLRNGHILLSKW